MVASSVGAFDRRKAGSYSSRQRPLVRFSVPLEEHSVSMSSKHGRALPTGCVCRTASISPSSRTRKSSSTPATSPNRFAETPSKKPTSFFRCASNLRDHQIHSQPTLSLLRFNFVLSSGAKTWLGRGAQ